MRALAPFVCIAQWRAGVLTPYADGSKLDFSEPLWRIDSSARAGHELETSLVLVNEQGALALLQAKHVLAPLILEELTMVFQRVSTGYWRHGLQSVLKILKLQLMSGIEKPSH